MKINYCSQRSQRYYSLHTCQVWIANVCFTNDVTKDMKKSLIYILQLTGTHLIYRDL